MQHKTKKKKYWYEVVATLDKKNERVRRQVTMVCSSCHLSEKVDRLDTIRAVRLRCSACGGPLNRPNQA